jgi:hypothetical protein
MLFPGDAAFRAGYGLNAARILGEVSGLRREDAAEKQVVETMLTKI